MTQRRALAERPAVFAAEAERLIWVRGGAPTDYLTPGEARDLARSLIAAADEAVKG
jgi:hypothetical protein